MKLYVIYDDGDGHKYLVPHDEYDTVKDIEAIGDQDALHDLLGSYDTLEGQEYLVALAEDL